MYGTVRDRRTLVTLIPLLAMLAAWPAIGQAQNVAGQAQAARATILDPLGGATTLALADTGTLGGTTDAREASQLSGEVTSILTGTTLHATTIGWPDQVASQASLADLALAVAGTSVGADFVMAEALAIRDTAGSGTTNIDNLAVNGVAVSVTGAPNQTIPIPGGRVVINEQQAFAGGLVVNALRVVVDGVADVVVGSATAGIR
jgi:hypothetical protein